MRLFKKFKNLVNSSIGLLNKFTIATTHWYNVNIRLSTPIVESETQINSSMMHSFENIQKQLSTRNLGKKINELMLSSSQLLRILSILLLSTITKAQESLSIQTSLGGYVFDTEGSTETRNNSQLMTLLKDCYVKEATSNKKYTLIATFCNNVKFYQSYYSYPNEGYYDDIEAICALNTYDRSLGCNLTDTQLLLVLTIGLSSAVILCCGLMYYTNCCRGRENAAAENPPAVIPFGGNRYFMLSNSNSPNDQISDQDIELDSFPQNIVGATTLN